MTREESIIIEELKYWEAIKSSDDAGFFSGFKFGAVGSLSNVMVALLTGRTAEQHKEEIAARKRLHDML